MIEFKFGLEPKRPQNRAGERAIGREIEINYILGCLPLQEDIVDHHGLMLRMASTVSRLPGDWSNQCNQMIRRQ